MAKQLGGQKIFIQGLKTQCIIGTLLRERRRKQSILIDLEFPAPVRKPARTDDLRKALDYQKIAEFVTDYVGRSKFHLLETLAERLAALLLKKFKLKQITLRVTKPRAIRNAQSAGVIITRKNSRK